MTATDDVIVDSMALPTFELEYGVDDRDSPTTVTVFAPGARDVSTAWLSIDAAHAVPVEEVA